MAEHALEESDVRRQTAGELSGPPLGEEAGWHLEQPRMELPPEPRDHTLAHGAEIVRLHVVEQGLDAEQEHEADRYAIEDTAIVFDEGRIQEKPGYPREY